MIYKLWDDFEKNFLLDSKGFHIKKESIKAAEEVREAFFELGNYPDKPVTVIQILEYENNKFIRIIE